jgi:hypothetical protein
MACNWRKQSLDLAFFAFGSPFIAQPGARPVSDEAEPHHDCEPGRDASEGPVGPPDSSLLAEGVFDR